MTLEDRQNEWLRLQRGRIERDFNALDPADPSTFFAGIAILRREFGRLIELSAPGGATLYEELNLYLDGLLAERLMARLELLTEKARRDPLTGIGHRGAFESRLRAEIERCRRYQRRLALILFDLDKFKQVNDRFGHPTGDRLLVDFSRSLARALRQSDEPFRIGGDEFAAILPETELETGEGIIRRIVESSDLSRWDGIFGLSWGIANWPADLQNNGRTGDPGEPEDPAEALVGIADRRLYERKSRQ
ncbi:MAG: GGDEF domain-containing protein [Acidobacteriota bacterium]